MILLPLVLAAATSAPDYSTSQAAAGRYERCVVDQVAEWAGGPDSAEVLVKTAESQCEDGLTEVKEQLQLFADSAVGKPGYENLTNQRIREFVNGGVSAVQDGVRTNAFTAILSARSKKTP